MWPSFMPSARDLEEMETLCESQTCDLKVDTGDARLWLARTSIEDGEPFRNTIYVELLDESGRWIDAGYYDGNRPPQGGAGWTASMFRGHF